MIKKIGLALVSMLLLYGYVLAGNADSQSPRRDFSGGLGDGEYRNTYINRVTSSGHIVNETGVGELGSPKYPWSKMHTTTGLARHQDTFIDLAAYSFDSVVQLLIATDVFVGGSISSTTLSMTMPAASRNLVIIASFTTGASTVSLYGYAVVFGTNSKGLVTSETIQFTTRNYHVDATSTSGVGNVAWASISSITIRGISLAGREGYNYGSVSPLMLRLGAGDKIGLSNDIISKSDVYKVNEAGTAITSYTLDTDYDTIDFATNGNGTNDYTVTYIQQTNTQE